MHFKTICGMEGQRPGDKPAQCNALGPCNKIIQP